MSRTLYAGRATPDALRLTPCTRCIIHCALRLSRYAVHKRSIPEDQRTSKQDISIPVDQITNRLFAPWYPDVLKLLPLILWYPGPLLGLRPSLTLWDTKLAKLKTVFSILGF